MTVTTLRNQAKGNKLYSLGAVKSELCTDRCSPLAQLCELGALKTGWRLLCIVCGYFPCMYSWACSGDRSQKSAGYPGADIMEGR